MVLLGRWANALRKPMRIHLLVAAVVSVFSLVAFLPGIVADLDSDGQALLEFSAYFPHLRKLNWNSILPICGSWKGIKCSKDGARVVAVHLPGVGLYGSIPSNSIGKLDALRVLSLRGNHLNGNLPSDILSIPSLQSVYLQHNNFSGNIPASLSLQLGVLNLSFNSFSGKIPPAIKNLSRLSVLNLQYNLLSGEVPDLGSSRLKNLNLSHNLLNGSIPDSLKKFPLSSFMGNSRLCGEPLTPCFSTSPPSSPPMPEKQTPTGSKRLSIAAIVIITVGACSVLFLLALVVVFFCLKRKISDGSSEVKEKVGYGGKSEKPEDFGSGVQDAEKNKLVFFQGCSYSFDLEDLLRASAEVLGKGSYGTAYKAVLDEATMVVVKRLREVCVGKREFEQHMEIIGRIAQHSNIVPPRAYYFSKDEKLLVCDYMPAGSLSAALQSNRGTGRNQLDWESRLKIAIGAAKGIAHIHSEGGAKFTHGNIKSSNVLLTTSMDGCISDIGLSPLMSNAATTSPRRPGYRAPEVFIETRRVTQKSDVYSFGVVVLEMLTGKSAVPVAGHDDIADLPRWVRSVVREEWTAEVFDVELMKYQNIEEEMVQMLQIALSCVAKSPDLRPTMAEVVRAIEGIRGPAETETEPQPSSDDNRSKDSNAGTPE